MILINSVTLDGVHNTLVHCFKMVVFLFFLHPWILWRGTFYDPPCGAVSWQLCPLRQRWKNIELERQEQEKFKTVDDRGVRLSEINFEICSVKVDILF